MLKEAGVFDRQNSILHHLRDVLDRSQISPLFSKLAEQGSLRREDAQWQLGAVVRQVRYVWKIGVSDRESDQHSQR